MKKARVSVIKTDTKPDDGAIERAVRQAIILAGGFEEAVLPGFKVMIKPNLVGVPDARYPGAVTNPAVCRAIADMVRERGAHPVIAESAQKGTDTESVIQATGYAELRKKGYDVVDLKKTPELVLDMPHGTVIKSAVVYDLASQVDAIISVPVLKTHDQLEITLGLKNMKGLVNDKTKILFHREGVIEGVVELCAALKPSYTVVDGILGQEGMGPMYGLPVEMDLIIAGKDAVAVDTVGGTIMGFAAKEVPITALAAKRGLGIMKLSDIDVVGELLEKVKRRFVRAHEDERVQVRGLSLIYDEGTCTGCRNAIYSVVFDLVNEDKLEYLEGATLVAGSSTLLKERDPRRVISVGRCCGRELKESSVHVKGCPPNNIHIFEALAATKRSPN